MERQVKSYRLDAPTLKALELMSEKDRRTQAQLIELSVEEYFSNHFAELFEATEAQHATAPETPAK